MTPYTIATPGPGKFLPLVLVNTVTTRRLTTYGYPDPHLASIDPPTNTQFGAQLVSGDFFDPYIRHQAIRLGSCLRVPNTFPRTLVNKAPA